MRYLFNALLFLRYDKFMLVGCFIYSGSTGSNTRKTQGNKIELNFSVYTVNLHLEYLSFLLASSSESLCSYMTGMTDGSIKQSDRNACARFLAVTQRCEVSS